MTLSSRCSTVVLALAAALTGCAGSGSALSGSDGAGGTSAQMPPTGAPDLLSFEGPATLTTVTDDTIELSVLADPPGRYAVRFVLLGDSLDASLDRSEVVTDDEGRVSVVLHAPTRSSAFMVRASSEGTASARLSISVSEAGFAIVEAVPEYDGTRPIDQWVATVAAGTTCAELPGTPPPDGPLLATSPRDLAPRVEDVPVGPVLAVTLRAGRFAGGCAEIEDTLAGEVNRVTIPIVDRPIQLDQTDLDIELGLDTANTEFEATMSAVIEAITAAAVSDPQGDVTALLDEMNEALPTDQDQTAFAAARSVNGWDQSVAGTMEDNLIRSLIADWMRAGLDRLDDPATFTGRLRSTGREGSSAELTLISVAGLEPEEAGFAVNNNPLPFTAEPGDTVHLGGTLFWNPSQLLSAVAIFGARQQVAVAKNVPEALSSVVGCSGIGSTLANSGGAQGMAFDGCDADCAEQLCDDALASLWQRAVDASALAGDIATLDVTAAGDATVDDEARPLGFDGSWVGRVIVGVGELQVGGPVRATIETPR